MRGKLTTAEFIERARAVHGDRYDYSQSVYDGSRKKVIIVCPDHGPFAVIPGNHLKPSDCPNCAQVRRRATRIANAREKFVERAKAIHGNNYDYSQSEYRCGKRNVLIICKEHGKFHQTPGHHLAGMGCVVCSGVNVSDAESFIARTKKQAW